MSGFGFDNLNEGASKQYLKEAGLHEAALFLGLSYDATDAYEFFDIEIETADGRYFRERTFGPDINKVYPKALYDKKTREKIGEETREQAFARVQSDINTKLLHLATCFVPREEVIAKVKGVRDLKEFIQAVNKAIGEPQNKINFLTIWKNNSSKQKSNLIIADKIKWCEAYEEGKPATISLTDYQIKNQTTELYPYKASNESTSATSPITNGQPVGNVDDDLPF